MLVKDSLRKFNRNLRNSARYDRFYRKIRMLVKGEVRPKSAGYYHDNYEQMPIIAGRVLLDSFWGRMIGCNPYALYLTMREDPRCREFQYIWVCNDPEIVPKGLLGDPAVSFVTYQSQAHQDAMLTAQYLVGNCNFPLHFAKKPDQIYVNVWHGTPLKQLGLYADDGFVPSANTQRNYLCSDYILSHSKMMTDRTVRAYGADTTLDRVHEIGTPRIDLTLATTRANVRDMLGVQGNKDILLYAPTWRGDFRNKNTDIQTQIDTITDVIAKFSDTYDIFLSAHHVTATALKKNNVYFRSVPPNIPINIILAGVDMLVSDYSSITVDYLSLNRPIALFCPDYETYGTTQGLHDNLRDLPVAFCDTLEGLQAAVKQARKPSEFENYTFYRSLLSDLEDGNASRRGLDIVLNQTKTTSYPAETRQRLLFYAGSFLSNGITSSIIALSNAIDHSQYEVTIVLNAAVIDKDINRQINLQKLSAHCRFVMRNGAATYTKEENDAYARFRQTGCYQSLGDRELIDAAFQREARRVFGDQTYDVAIDFSGYSTLWSLMMCHTTARKKLIYQHSDMKLEAYNPNTARSFPELPAVFSLYERYDGIVSVTPEMSLVNQESLAPFYTEDTQFYVVQNMFSAETIRTRSEIPLAQVSPEVMALIEDKDLYLFCCVARLSAEKNHARLLDAFAIAHKETPGCALLIIGGGKLDQSLKKQAKRLAIDEHVIFLGHQDNPYSIMRACDCKVLASAYEGQGIVLLEALALDLACIATDNPAIRSILKNDVGIIVPQSTTALAQAMSHAVNVGMTSTASLDDTAYATSALKQFYDSVSL